MKALPPGGVASCDCVEIHLAPAQTHARILLYDVQRRCVGESRVINFSDESRTLLLQLKDSIEHDLVMFLGGGGEQVAPFSIQPAGGLAEPDYQDTPGPRDYQADS
jgi:hypothetical protein